MTKVNYLNFRTLCLVALVGLSALTGGCLAGSQTRIVSPVSGDAEGPRSFDALSREIVQQSEKLRLLAIRNRGLYPYYVNRYRVRFRIEEGGEVSNVELLERGYLLPEFEDRFLEIVSGFEFSESEGDPVELIYTFEFYPEAPKGALEYAAAKEKAAREGAERAKAAEQAAMMKKEPAVQIAPEAVMPAPPAEDESAGMDATPAAMPDPEDTAEPVEPEPEPEPGMEAAPEAESEAAPVDEPAAEEPAAMSEPDEMMDEPEMEEAPEFDEADLEENSSTPKQQ